MKPQKSIGSTPDPSTRQPNVQEQNSVKKNLSWAKDPKAQAGVATGIGATWMFFLGAIPGALAFLLAVWLIVSGARAEGGFSKNRWILVSALVMILGAFIPEFTGVPKSFRNLEGTERVVPEVLRDDRGGQEQSTTRGEVLESLSLPPATQLPTTWTFSSSGRLEVQGKYRLQLQGGRYAEFDVKNGDYVESDGYVGNELPSSNVSQYLAPDLSVGLLIIRSQDGRWYKADQFDVIPGVQYELALNSNQDYPQYVTYLQPPEITVLSQE